MTYDTATGDRVFSDNAVPQKILIFLAYFIVPTGIWGRTIGKWVAGIVVVDQDGRIPGVAVAIPREIVGKVVSYAALGFGFAWILFDAKRRGWHDSIAGTYVVHDSGAGGADPGQNLAQAKVAGQTILWQNRNRTYQLAISSRVREQLQESSWIRRMFEEGIELRRIHGADKVFDLSLGNPILEPPPEFRTELMRIAQDETLGTHRYMPNNGLPETRAAVAAELSDETALPFTADDVMMTVGAAGALNVILRSLLDQDDEVVLFAPYFAEYVFYISHQGGQTKVAHCDEYFQPDPESLAAAITPRTRAVIINSPNNPTGVIYPAERIAELGEVNT